MVKSNGWATTPSQMTARNYGFGTQSTNGRPLLRQLGKYAGQCVLLAASLACVVFPSHAANPDLIPVANHTSFSDEELGKYLAENLNQNLKDEIKKRNLAVFALNATFPGQRACFASVGLTELATANRSARMPQYMNQSFTRFAENDWDPKATCGSDLVDAISAMNSKPLEKVLEEIERATSGGGIRSNGPLLKSTVHLLARGVEDKSELFTEIHEHKFSAAFDHRHVATQVYASGIQFDSGSYMCVAFAGVGARTSDGRNFRWPAVTTSYVRLQTGGTVEVCKGIVAKQAIHGLLEKPWTADGLLKSFELTREDGIPLPDAVKVSKIKATIDRVARVLAESEARRANQPKSVQVASTSRTSNRSYCENSCVNGMCIRSFPNGTKERWQAPRIYNPLISNWEWDITTNACGA